MLVPFLGCAMLVLVSVFAAAKSQLHHVCPYALQCPQSSNFQSALQSVDKKVHFSCFSIAFDLFSPNPQQTYLHFGQYVMRSWLNSIAVATCVCMCNIGLASLHPFLPVPVSNLLALPITHFSGQIHLVLSLFLLTMV